MKSFPIVTRTDASCSWKRRINPFSFRQIHIRFLFSRAHATLCTLLCRSVGPSICSSSSCPTVDDCWDGPIWLFQVPTYMLPMKAADADWKKIVKGSLLFFKACLSVRASYASLDYCPFVFVIQSLSLCLPLSCVVVFV